jgi:hypothetical protein
MIEGTPDELGGSIFEPAKAAPTSERKREANRRNAQRSTGPKTEPGKAISRLNSLKHGLLARALPLRNLPFLPGEEEKDLDKLLDDLYIDLRPQGRVEEILVERIACIHFQHSRLCRFQTAAAAIALWKELDVPTLETDPLTTLRLKEELSKKLKTVLERCKQESVSEELMKEVCTLILGPNCLHALQKLYDEIKQATARESNGSKDRAEELKRRFTTVLAFSMGETQRDAKRVSEMGEELAKARFEQHLLPDEGTLRRVLRYESMLDRELHRCLDRLERMQARRGIDPLQSFSRVVEGICTQERPSPR